MANIRTFIALEMPFVVTQQLAGVMDQLGFLGDRVRWAKPDGVHLTLKFLGDVSAECIGDIVEIAQHVAAQSEPLTLQTSGVGGFPNLEKARVLWLGIRGDVDALSQLQETLERHLEPLGFERERRKFFPHLTAGRARRQPVCVERDRLAATQPIHFRVDRLTVMKSELRPEGAVYTPLGYGMLTG